MIELFKTIHAEFLEEVLKPGTRRDMEPIMDVPSIVTIIGGRRTGKTTLLKQMIHKLVEGGTPKEHIVYINFEDERIPRETGIFQDLLDARAEMFPGIPIATCWFFFDEIHEIPGWELFLRRLHENYSSNIFLTGSSSKLLSKEIATTLRGRTISQELYPFSFREFLIHKGYDPEKQHTTREKAAIRNELRNYLREGGYPETIGQSYSVKTKILRSYLDVMIFRDLIERHQITNHHVLRQYIKKMLANTAREASVHKTFQELKSQGHKVSKDLLYNFQVWCEEIYLLFQLPQYHGSLVKQQSGSKKIYGIDTGLINSTSFRASQDLGRMMENLVFLELKRRGLDVFYNKEEMECDFLIRHKERIIHAIQVTCTLSDEAVRKREIAGLVHAMNKYKLDTGTLITMSDERITLPGTHQIQVWPLWKWLLNTHREYYSLS